MRWVGTRLCKSGLIGLLSLIGGCVGPTALDRAVMGYDEATAVLEQKLILMNIARRTAGWPVHFTVTGSIAATFNWNVNANIDGAVGPAALDLANISLGTSRSENPTFSIFPISGEEFTQRILSPVPESVFNTIMFQGEGLDEALRLMSRGVEVINPADDTFIRLIANDPERPEEYEEFRRIVQHLQWMFWNRMLYIRTLAFEEPLIENFSTPPQPYDINQGIFNNLVWRQQPDGTYKLTRNTSGRLVITNYDPYRLTDQERWDLNLRISKRPTSLIHIDIDPCCPGGEYPLHGKVAMRSIVQMLDFIGRGLEEFPEYDVPKDPRTAYVQDNPANTLKINVTDNPPSDLISVPFRGKHYSIGTTKWDQSVFRILAWLFQATVGDIKNPGIPITIAK